MDEFLNELYGTSETISGEDVEKQAAAEFLVKLAEQEGVNLDDLSDEEVGSLLSEIEGEMGKEAEAESTVDDQEAQEKLAEADFLGRAMAHAYVNELAEIEKEAGRAGAAYQAAKGAVGRALGRAGEWTGVSGMREARRLGRAASKEKGELARGIRTLAGKGDKGTLAIRSLGKRHAGAAKDIKTYKGLGREYGKQFAKRVVAPAAGVAAVGTGAALAAKKMKEKKSFDENFEALAEQRAYEMLEEAGYQVEKVAESEVEVRALQMLEEAGYPVEWE